MPTASPSGSPTPAIDPLRHSNDIPNNRMPTAAELTAFNQGVGACGGLDDCSYMQNVTGQFTGTTQQIIQQVADKWCPNCTILNPYDGKTYSFEDLMKAVAVNETNWYEWKSASLLIAGSGYRDDHVDPFAWRSRACHADPARRRFVGTVPNRGRCQRRMARVISAQRGVDRIQRGLQDRRADGRRAGAPRSILAMRAAALPRSPMATRPTSTTPIPAASCIPPRPT